VYPLADRLASVHHVPAVEVNPAVADPYAQAAALAHRVASVNVKTVISVLVPTADPDVHVPEPEHAVIIANAVIPASARNVRIVKTAAYARHVIVDHVRSPADVPERYATNAINVRFAAIVNAVMNPVALV